MNRLLLLSFIIVLTACSDSKKDDVGAWFGGQIINPTTHHVILTKNDRVVDTIDLNQENRFMYRIDSVEKGIYNFIHNEYQIIYLEPGDSLMLYLNTVEFDESLAFSGRGANQNNFLIKMFLHNEQEGELIPKYYRLPTEGFLKSIDSLKTIKTDKLNEFISNKDVCKDFISIANAKIEYNDFLKREIYPYAHYGFNKTVVDSLPEGYYDYRKRIDYNNTLLQTYYPYYRFMNYHFDYLSFEEYKAQETFDRHSFIHNKYKLNLIDQYISNSFLKDKLLRNAIRSYLINTKTLEENSDIVELYKSLNTNPDYDAEIDALAAAAVKIMPGKKLPNLKIFDTNKEQHYLQDVITQPTVVYFWSPKQVSHHKNVHAKIDELQKKYPEYEFVAISTEENNEIWKQAITRNNYSSNEFRFVNTQSAIDKLVINSINKVLIVDKNGVIFDNHSNLFHTRFEEQLLGYLNQ